MRREDNVDNMQQAASHKYIGPFRQGNIELIFELILKANGGNFVLVCPSPNISSIILAKNLLIFRPFQARLFANISWS